MDRVVAIRDGKTSSEIVRRKLSNEELIESFKHAEEIESHEELAVLDSAGRLQIPREYLAEIGINDSNKLRIELEDGKIVLKNPVIK